MTHGRKEVRPGIERERCEDVAARQMMLENSALGGRQRAGGWTMQVAQQVALAISSHAIAQDEIVHPSANVDRIDLNKPAMRQCGGDIGRGGIEEQSTAMKAAGIER